MSITTVFSAAMLAALALIGPLYANEAGVTGSPPLTSEITDAITFGPPLPDPIESGYETVDGLDMHYQVFGAGEPLVLLHGGLMTIEAIGPLIPALAESRTVYALELEGHGRTVDLDRPLSMRQFASDVAGFIAQKGLGPVDLVGFSMGGGTAMGVAILEPELVGRLVVISATHQPDAIHESVRAGWPHMSVQMMAGTPMEEAYMAVAPQPERFAGFIDKIRDMMISGDGWTDDEVASISAPTLLVLGDTDLIQLDKALETFGLLGGAQSTGPMGPEIDADRQFAVLPATTHYDILYRLDLLMPVVMPFLSGPPAR